LSEGILQQYNALAKEEWIKTRHLDLGIILDKQKTEA